MTSEKDKLMEQPKGDIAYPDRTSNGNSPSEKVKAEILEKFIEENCTAVDYFSTENHRKYFKEDIDTRVLSIKNVRELISLALSHNKENIKKTDQTLSGMIKTQEMFIRQKNSRIAELEKEIIRHEKYEEKLMGQIMDEEAKVINERTRIMELVENMVDKEIGDDNKVFFGSVKDFTHFPDRDRKKSKVIIDRIHWKRIKELLAAIEPAENEVTKGEPSKETMGKFEGKYTALLKSPSSETKFGGKMTHEEIHAFIMMYNDFFKGVDYAGKFCADFCSKFDIDTMEHSFDSAHGTETDRGEKDSKLTDSQATEKSPKTSESGSHSESAVKPRCECGRIHGKDNWHIEHCPLSRKD